MQNIKRKIFLLFLIMSTPIFADDTDDLLHTMFQQIHTDVMTIVITPISELLRLFPKSELIDSNGMYALYAIDMQNKYLSPYLVVANTISSKQISAQLSPDVTNPRAQAIMIPYISEIYGDVTKDSDTHIWQFDNPPLVIKLELWSECIALSYYPQ